jgi:hypothetical protein
LSKNAIILPYFFRKVKHFQKSFERISQSAFPLAVADRTGDESQEKYSKNTNRRRKERQFRQGASDVVAPKEAAAAREMILEKKSAGGAVCLQRCGGTI